MSDTTWKQNEMKEKSRWNRQKGLNLTKNKISVPCWQRCGYCRPVHFRGLHATPFFPRNYQRGYLLVLVLWFICNVLRVGRLQPTACRINLEKFIEPLLYDFLEGAKEILLTLKWGLSVKISSRSVLVRGRKIISFLCRIRDVNLCVESVLQKLITFCYILLSLLYMEM